jgi:glycosyltransferase involved in cell wall biosynthesis
MKQIDYRRLSFSSFIVHHSSFLLLSPQSSALSMMTGKLKVLAWSDAVVAATGFGTVSRHVLAELHRSGRYHIDQLAINYHGEFFDTTKYPYQLSPARLLDPADAFGKAQLIRALTRSDYDILWILNDPDVVNDSVDELQKLAAQKKSRGGKAFKTIYYYPVDAAVVPEVARMIPFADVPVTYTQFGRQQTLMHFPGLEQKLVVIGHGCDTASFHPLGPQAKQTLRVRHMAIKDPATFLVVNVNRNLPRKDLPRCILAFREFKKRVPDSLLYLHCEPKEYGTDLIRCCRTLGVSSRDVLFPEGMRLADGGFPVEALNNVYNMADAFLTTTLGEGWGLTMTEAMCAGTPVVAPNNSSIPEILGSDGDRGYIYEPSDLIWSDSAYRPLARVEQIVGKLYECYEQRGTPRQQQIIGRALQFAREHTWQQVSRQWLALFDSVARLPS